MEKLPALLLGLLVLSVCELLSSLESLPCVVRPEQHGVVTSGLITQLCVLDTLYICTYLLWGSRYLLPTL